MELDMEQLPAEELSSRLVVVPGEEITRGVGAGGFLRGHGTFVENIPENQIGEDVMYDEEGNEIDEDGKPIRLVASVAGVVLKVNKLISVKPIQSRYSGDIGDVVIARIAEIGNKQWRVDLGSRQLGTLLLGSINLPGGALRRRTLEDQLQMRTLFKEDELLSAEVANFFQHGGIAIHARSMRYGKLENGTLVNVPPSLMKRLSQHFVTLPCGVDAIFALNGRIWLTGSASKESDDDDSDEEMAAGETDRTRMIEEMESEKQKHSERFIDAKTRLKISRVRNCIVILAKRHQLISPQSIMELYESSLGLQSPKIMLTPDALA